jgi:hypothetical protein
MEGIYNKTSYSVNDKWQRILNHAVYKLIIQISNKRTDVFFYIGIQSRFHVLNMDVLKEIGIHAAICTSNCVIILGREWRNRFYCCKMSDLRWITNFIIAQGLIYSVG